VVRAYAVSRIQGSVVLNDQPIGSANLRAFDLASGKELPLIAAGGQNLIAAGGQNLIAAGGQNLIAAGGQNLIAAGGQNLIAAGGQNLIAAGGQNLIAAGGQNLIAAGGQNLIAAGGQNLVDAATGQLIAAGGQNLTSATGQFDVLMAPGSEADVVKLVAEREGRALVALFDGGGRAVGADSLIAAGGQNLIAAGGQNLIAAGGQNLIAAGGQNLRGRYGLQQASGTVQLKLRLTAASTAAAKSFEGAVKLQFQLKKDLTPQALARVFAAANRAIQKLEAAFARQPDLADKVVAAVDPKGELEAKQDFQAALLAAGVVEALKQEVTELLTTFTTEAKENRTAEPEPGDLDAVSQEDFPIGDVKVEVEGAITYTDTTGQTVTTEVQNEVRPATRETAPPTAPQPPPTSEQPASSGGGGRTAPPVSAVGGAIVVSPAVAEPLRKASETLTLDVSPIFTIPAFYRDRLDP
jgi:hypothetical protein